MAENGKHILLLQLGNNLKHFYGSGEDKICKNFVYNRGFYDCNRLLEFYEIGNRED